MLNLVTLGLMARYRDFYNFYYINPCKTCDPPGVMPNLIPKAVIWALLIQTHQIKPQAKFSNPAHWFYAV